VRYTDLAYRISRIPWVGLDLIFPPLCGGCNRSGARWCAKCRSNLISLAEPICEICGLPIPGPGRCAACAQEQPSFRVLRSWSAFDGPIRNALHRLKYRRDLGLGDALAEHLVGFVQGLGWPVEMIVPVPLGAARLKERGYNQISLVARPLALAMGIAYAPHALIRARETRSQVGLTKSERHENVRGAFLAGNVRLDGRVVLLIDDVATTGSTLSSCAEALCRAGARDVFALTVARALVQHAWKSV
jgi:competence protein ComFC